ncbi:MAG: Mrp/NBP35 family ATP-binding protein [Phycisphaerales bacterium]|nr:Mrp/NBP35 family ATP-binding protein [Phycisphaerales bacterium]
MALTKEHINEALSGVMHPSGEDLVSKGCVMNVAVCDEHASVRICMTQGDPSAAQPSREQLAKIGAVIDASVRSTARDQGVDDLGLIVDFVDHQGEVVMKLKGDQKGVMKDKSQSDKHDPNTPTPQNSGATGVPGVKHIIAVGAGKGGVGKSTVAVNLAIGLARKGHSVGLLDGDIYGPSLPTMLGLHSMEQVVIEGALQPFMAHGIKSITMGKLVETDKPLIWRGPMAHGAFHQLIERTQWGELDYLIIDLPPGTGDVPLTLAQSVQLSGAVVVCTPQKVAQDDAVRASAMFESLGVEVLGVVENMSYFIGDDGKEYDIFGRGGAQTMAQRLNHSFLGAIPINMALRANCDGGKPSHNFDPKTAGGESLPKALEGMVDQFESQVMLSSMSKGSNKPTLTIS